MARTSLGVDEYLFVAEEDSFGEAKYPDSHGFLPHTSSKLRLNRATETRRERTTSRGYRERVGLRKDASFEIEGYLTLASGDDFAGTSALLSASGFRLDTEVAQATIQDSPPPSTTGFAVDPSDAFSAGDFVDVDGVVRYVVSCEAGWVEVTPPLPSAPAPQTTVSSIFGLRPAEDAAPRSLSLFRRGSIEAEIACGCVPASLALEFSGGEPVRLRVSGGASDVVMWAYAKLAADIDDSETEIGITPIHNIEPNAVISIDDELMKVVDVDYEDGTATVERGWGNTQAASHSQNADIKPYWIEPTTPGKLLYGTHGEIFVNSSPLVLVDFELGFEQGVELFNSEYGTEVATRALLSKRRGVSVKVKVLLDTDSADRLMGTRHDEQMPVFIAAYGDDAAVAIYLPKVEFDIPEIARDEQREVLVELRGVALESEGWDEVFIGLKV